MSQFYEASNSNKDHTPNHDLVMKGRRLLDITGGNSYLKQ
jgi:hypothetical protein